MIIDAGLSPTEQIKFIKENVNCYQPNWSELYRQYDPLQHSIYDTSKYPIQLNQYNVDDFKRCGIGMQKLAVNRLAQNLFSQPVKRVYTYNTENQQLKDCVKIFETVSKNYLNIDSVNIERAKSLFSACEVCSIVYVTDEQMIIGDYISPKKINIKLYSPDKGYTLFPILDDFGNIDSIGISMIDFKGNENFYFYSSSKIIFYKKVDGEFIITLEQSVSSISFTYINRNDPAWGGLAGTQLVEQLEEINAYQGYYIARNSVPTFMIDKGEVAPGSRKSESEEDDGDDKRYLYLGKGANVQDVTWQGAGEAIKQKTDFIISQFWDLIQISDMSFSKLLGSNTSFENKELVMSDSRAKSVDEGGEFNKLFSNENNIIKNFLKVLFPALSQAFDAVMIRTVITPFSIKTKKEIAEYIDLAGGSMSTKTKIRLLDEVDDVEQEEAEINGNNEMLANQI